jgi:hypothetical protein
MTVLVQEVLLISIKEFESIEHRHIDAHEDDSWRIRFLRSSVRQKVLARLPLGYNMDKCIRKSAKDQILQYEVIDLIVVNYLGSQEYSLVGFCI